MILNQPASAGWRVRLQERAAAAVESASDELAAQLPEQSVLHIDESPTKQGPAQAWGWTFMATSFTFFQGATSRAADVPKALLGADYGGIIHCDRARMYWAFGRLQGCWAHLKQDFPSRIDSPCPTKKRLGHDLMRPTKALFALWQKVRDGTLSRPDFQKQMQSIRVEINALFLRGSCNALTQSVCRELVEHRVCLWNFVDHVGIDPTNNAAEQALRHAVIWRKLSFGTQSASGSRFVERLLTVIETARRQGRDVFRWLITAVQANCNGKPTPSLLLIV